MRNDVASGLLLCDAAGALASHCLVHAVWEWEARWSQQGFPQLLADVEATMLARPEQAEVDTFGDAVGTVAGRIAPRPGSQQACKLIPLGGSHQSCRQALLGGPKAP